VIWYDRRVDPVENYLIDVYSTTSVDDGETFGPNERITDVSFGVPPINPNFDPNVVACYMGDYIAVAGRRHHYGLGRQPELRGRPPRPGRLFDAAARDSRTR
jgi:hypothetical protein